MKLKSLGIALGMAAGLFLYGYLLSTAGHDHSAHQNGGHDQKTAASEAHGHGDHDHSHDHH